MQTVDSFLVCPHNLGEKRQINLSYQNFKTRANWQRSLKGNKKNLLDWKLQNFKAKWALKKTPSKHNEMRTFLTLVS